MNNSKNDNVINKLINFLELHYKTARCSLNYSTPFQLLVATILSAQCTDERVNKVTSVLFKKYKEPRDFLNISLEELMTIIKPTGFYRNKAKNIKELSSILVEKYKGEVPSNIEDLVKLPGVGRKTANVVLGNCFGIRGVVVDTHVQRIVQRLGIVNTDKPEKIEFELMRLMPNVNWTKWSHQMIAFGRDVCKAKKPECFRCELRQDCSYYAKSHIKQ
jgi:endonuclease-3